MADITGSIDLGSWLNKMYSDYQDQSAKKDTMFGQGISALQSYADVFRPGGEYGAGTEAMIQRGGEKAVAGGMQSLVSAGLANTTMPMHLQQTYEEEVGMPTRLASRDRGMEMYGTALGNIGQAYASYDPVSPAGYGISSMATGGFGTMMQGRIADMNAQQQMRDRQAANQADSPSQQMFGGGAGSGGGGTYGTGSTGGGVMAGGAYTRSSSGGFTNPYGGGGGGSGGGGGDNIMAGLYDAEHLQGGLGT